MAKYIIKRVVSGIITLWAVITITFVLIHSIPGGPFDKEKQLPKEVKEQIEKAYNLDKPLWWQYQDYLKKLILKGDMGPSFKYKGTQVVTLIKRGFPVSARLGGVTIITVLIIGIPFGIISALNQGKWQDRLLMLVQFCERFG
jgi:oligopeptide transport system permease protein